MIVVAAMYIGLCLLLAWFANYLEKRNRRSKKVIDIPDTAKIVHMDDASVTG
jgi:glutamate transport system permease protein